MREIPGRSGVRMPEADARTDERADPGASVGSNEVKIKLFKPPSEVGEVEA